MNVGAFWFFFLRVVGFVFYTFGVLGDGESCKGGF
jgi:hypothetical protein